MRRSIQLAAAALFVMSVSSVHAFPINIANSGATLVGPDLTELQSILNNVYSGAAHTPDALADQIHQGTFFLPAGAAAEFTVQYEDTYLTTNTFGIFSAAQGTGGMLDSTTLQTLKLFQGTPATINPYGQVSPQVSAAVAFDSHTGQVTTTATNSANCGVLVNCGTFQPAQPITSSLFGFYENRPTTRPTGGDYGTDGYNGNFWTINQLNSDTGSGAGFPQALIYKETISTNQDRWTIAFDDVHTTNPDFNDFVLTMDVYRDGVIPAVPEPGALLLFGTALLGSVSMLRRMARR